MTDVTNRESAHPVIGNRRKEQAGLSTKKNNIEKIISNENTPTKSSLVRRKLDFITIRIKPLTSEIVHFNKMWKVHKVKLPIFQTNERYKVPTGNFTRESLTGKLYQFFF